MSSERPDLAEYTRLRGFTYQAKERQQLPPSFRIDFASPLEPSSPVGNGLEVVHFPAEFPHQGSYIEVWCLSERTVPCLHRLYPYFIPQAR